MINSASILGQALDTRVAFRIEATDTLGASSRFPVEEPVYPGDQEKRECFVRFGEEPASGTFGSYRIWMTLTNQTQWADRSQIHAGLLNATFVYADQRVINNIGAAYNGSDNTSIYYNSPTNGLCGYTLSFPSDDSLLGATDMLLDWSIQDPTGQREQLAYWMAGQLGAALQLPAVRAVDFQRPAAQGPAQRQQQLLPLCPRL